MAELWLDLLLLVATLVLFNIAAKTRGPNPPVGRRLACLYLGVFVFGGIYGTFFAWCRLVVRPWVLEALKAGRRVGLVYKLFGRLGELSTHTIVLGYLFGCVVIYAAIELVSWKCRRDSGGTIEGR